jgi:outer membrane lipoprotein-sorting protein
MRNALILFSCLLLFSCMAPVQEEKKDEPLDQASELLELVAKRMKDTREISFELEYHKFKEPVPITYWIKKPNQLRNLWSLPKDQSMLMLWDGSQVWTYRSWDNRYARVEQPPGSPVVLSLKDPITALFLSESVKEVLTGVTIERVEKKTVEEKSYDLITWNIGEAARGQIWIDENKRIYRYGHEQGGARESAIVQEINLKPAFAEDAFSFVPPEGATLEEAPTRGKLLAEGTIAPDFQATRLDGQSVKLSDFKGKTVLLNFWAYV